MPTEVSKAVEPQVIHTPKSKWFQDLIKTVRATASNTRETVARLVLESHHELGSLMIEAEPQAKKSKITAQELVELVSQATDYSRTTIYDAVLFARTYPNLEEFSKKYQEISWNKVKKLLYKKDDENSTGGKEEEKKKVAFKTCSTCNGKGYVEA